MAGAGRGGLRKVVLADVSEIVVNGDEAYDGDSSSASSTTSAKLGMGQVWDMMKSIYNSTEYFCQTLTERYPPPPPPTASNLSPSASSPPSAPSSASAATLNGDVVSPALVNELSEHRRLLESVTRGECQLSPPLYLLVCLEPAIDNPPPRFSTPTTSTIASSPSTSATQSVTSSSSSSPSSPSSGLYITIDTDAVSIAKSEDSDPSDAPTLEPVGFIKVVPNKVPRLSHTADLTMGLVPRVCGKGIGKFALDQTLVRLRQSVEERRPKGLSAVEIVYLMVREDNQSARALYRKAGFEQVAVLTKDTKISDDLYYDGILMRKFLT